jgi:carboxylate-amine ligase
VAAKKPPLTIGLEEELFLVDLDTRRLSASWPQEFSLECTSKYPDQIVHEFLNCQVELISKPHQTIAELESEFLQLRTHAIDCAKKYDMGIIAASTHPFSTWHEQTTSENKRYSRLEDNLQFHARRMLVSGMHIHIGIDDDEQRLELINKITAFLPLILALSTSSPFWSGVDSGLTSVRAGVLNGLPRSGLPEMFKSFEEYEQYISALIKAGAIESAREIWWDVRASAHYPTVEIRVADTCTLLSDSLALCALVQCLAHYLLFKDDTLISANDLHLIKENKWRAQRYAVTNGSLIDLKTAELQTYRDLVIELLEKLEDSAKELDNFSYLSDVEKIIKRGTSADEQIKVYNSLLRKESDSEKALIGVVDTLIKKTAQLKSSTKKKMVSLATV